MTSFDPAALLVARTRTADEGAIIRMAQKSRELRAKGMDVVSLTVGEPDFDTPDNIQQAATAAMKAGFTHYSPVQGIPELRAALSQETQGREQPRLFGQPRSASPTAPSRPSPMPCCRSSTRATK